MLACLDVAYSDDKAYAACALLAEWRAEHPLRMVARRVDGVAPYEPGAFYKRELPVLLEVLAEAGERYTTIVVDGYVWLDAQLRPGLGAHLYHALGEAVPVIGVAKTPFHDDVWSVRALRGRSQRPLFVTAAGVDATEAAARIVGMHGSGRIPTILRLVDRRARDEAAKAQPCC